jgi:hypothetical protein
MGDPFTSYMTDAWQRSILFWDVLRQRGNQYLEHTARTAPHVLQFKTDVVLDGRTLKKPVNYALVRIEPPEGVEIDPLKPPYVVIDPRAGHGPGIGGFKHDSEIGMALNAGHPCYFIGFLPEPVPGQTIEDILSAQAVFIERVIALHPKADGKPCVIGNCQAGWALMMLASLRPELFGPLVIAGSPLSYWAGVHGKNPMRYTGGLLGGSWLTALTGDLGNGKFDGAWLVNNFENLNPSNTLWTKQYNVYSNVDTEGPRYLEFERWWGGHVNLNAEEMQFIVDQLFVGNKLATGDMSLSDGTPIDLRKIRSPIVVFCSDGDNITPPQQALGWITDLYRSVDDIRAHGQTIIYAVHASIGHLGIFVSAKVARKEHSEFASNMDFINFLPSGLYEAVLAPREKAGPVDPDAGEYVLRFEARTLEHIKALGNNDDDDERRFATVARVSEITNGVYRTLVQPWVRTFAGEQSAALMQRLHPARLQFTMFSDQNPFMRTIAQMAEQVREQRKPAEPDNPFVAAEHQVSNWIETALDGFRDMRDQSMEQAFLAWYGSPWLQALVGLKADDEGWRRRPAADPEHQKLVEHKIAELRRRITEGSAREALIRGALYVMMPQASADERGFLILRRLRSDLPESKALSLDDFRRIVREQFLMLVLDQQRAVAAIPGMLSADADARRRGLKLIRSIAEARGPLSGETAQRLDELERMLGRDASKASPESAASDRAERPPGRKRAEAGEAQELTK